MRRLFSRIWKPSLTALLVLGGTVAFLVRTDRHYHALRNVTSSALTPGPQRGEWKQLRGDGVNSGFQPFATGIVTPVEKSGLTYSGYEASYALFSDITGDGDADLVIPESSGISAWTQAGTLLWRNQTLPQGLLILEALDLVGDGAIQIVLLSDSHLYFLDGATGALRLELSFAPLRTFYWNLHFIPPADGAIGRQMVVALNQGSGTEPGTKIQTRLYGFTHGLGTPDLLWKKDVQESTAAAPTLIYWASSVVGDVDNDGAPDMVTAVGKGFVIQDLTTGNIKRRMDADWNRSYGTLLIDDLDHDGKNELLVASDLLEQHLHTFRCTTVRCRSLASTDLGAA
jgi:hypothetical protein